MVAGYFEGRLAWLCFPDLWILPLAVGLRKALGVVVVWLLLLQR